VEPLGPEQIRSSFVNASRSQVKAVTFPSDLQDLRWEDHDLVGWRDPKAPSRAYLVTEHGQRTVGVLLRAPAATPVRRAKAMCSLCHAVHPADGVALYVAPRAGAAGKRGDSVGTYICADLGCSLYARGLRATSMPPAEPVGPQRVANLRARIGAFVQRVLAPSDR